MNVHDVRALGHDQMHGLSHSVRQLLHRPARHLHQIEILDHLPRQGVQPGSHAVVAGGLVLAHVAARRHRRQHPVHRALVQAGALGQRMDGKAVARTAQALHNVKRAVKRLDRRCLFRHRDSFFLFYNMKLCFNFNRTPQKLQGIFGRLQPKNCLHFCQMRL